MKLIERIEEDYKTAFKAHDDAHVSALRLMKAAIKNAEIEARHELSDEEIIVVLTREAKRRRESIVMYEQGGRAELAATEKIELDHIAAYQPAQMGDDELAAIVKTVITEQAATAKDFGAVMGAVMVKVKGQADGNRVAAAVKQNLK
jgi:uncharacterized protein